MGDAGYSIRKSSHGVGLCGKVNERAGYAVEAVIVTGHATGQRQLFCFGSN